jgi:hypothetical protein
VDDIWYAESCNKVHYITEKWCTYCGINMMGKGFYDWDAGKGNKEMFNEAVERLGLCKRCARSKKSE